MQRTNPDLFTVDPAKTRALRTEADNTDWATLDRVLPHHRVYLARRGVSAFVAKGRGYESVGKSTMRPDHLPDTATGWTDEQRTHILGIAPVVTEPDAPKPVGRPRKDAAPKKPNERSLMLPFFSLSAHADLPVIWQARPDVAREIDDRPLKFEVPAGVKRGDREGELPVDVHPMLHARKSGGARRFDLTDRPVFLTEGILKSDSVLSQSIREGVMLSPCAISGVTMGYLAPASVENPFSLNKGTVPVLTEAMRNLTEWDGRVVYLCWDADWMTNPGVYEPLFTTARLLEAEGATVRIVCVPTVKNDPKTGVDDYIAWAQENEVVSPLVEMLSGAISVEDAEWHVASYEEDDLGRGEHLAAYLSRNLSAVWNASRGSWMSYDEETGIWATDNAGTGILRVARDVFARDSQRSVRNMESAIKVARTYPGVHRAENEFDQYPELMTVANGVVDLRTGELLDFDPALMLTQRSTFNFDPKMVASVADGSADWSNYCPTWMTFLDTTFAGDTDTIESIQRQLGERLYGAIRDHQMVWWYSDGRSGKGTITTVFHALLGTGAGGFTGVLEPGALVDPNGFAPWVRASLLGRRGIVVQELGAGAKLLEERIKKLTRGDLIQAEFKHGDAFDFQPTGKLIGVTNHLPEVFALDRGTWSSMKLVPFPLSLGEDEIDTTLGARLELEYPAILAWMIEGAMKYIESGQYWSPYIEAATREWALARDLVATTLSCIEYADDPDATIPFESVRNIYREVARTEGRSGSANKSAVAIYEDMKSHREMPHGVSLVNTSRRRQFRNARLTKEGEKLAGLGGRSENY